MAERRPPSVPTQRSQPTQRSRPTRGAQAEPRKPSADRQASTRRSPAAPRPEPRGAASRENTASAPVRTRGPEALAWQPVRQRERVDTVTHRMRERLAERRRTERRRAAVKWGRYGLAAGVVMLIVWLVLRSPVFLLDPAKVELSGVTPEVDAAAIDTVLAQYDGSSLALLNVPHVADQLRDLVGVQDATVERVWPAGLRVTISPRHPVAAIASGGGFVLLDADAVKVGEADAAPANLPVLDIPLGTDNDRILDAVLEVVRNLPQDVLDRVESVGAETEDTVAFTLRDGPRVEWGSSQDSALKAQVLDVMLTSGAASAADVIDVSAPTLPITRHQD